MKMMLRKAVAVMVAAAASMILAGAALADDEWPFVQGDYWDVTAIDIKDGGSWKYANWLATEWRKSSEFAKSKGWIKDYMILSNVHGRKGEADLYIVRVIDSVVSGAEGEKRQKEYSDWVKKSNEKMVEESGNRAEYREVTSSSLLQVLNFRD